MNDLKTVEHKNCRLCGHSPLNEVFSLGDQYINDFVTKDRIEKGLKAPLEIVHCTNCDLSQLKHTAPQELLYSRQYWYRSGVTDTMKRELKDIVNEVSSKVDLNSGDIVLDIGANDGTMLSYFPESVLTVGCEPANNLVDELSKNCNKVIHDFWSDEVYFKAVNKKTLIAKLITPVFKDEKNGVLKVISFFAKKARGMMARYILQNHITDVAEIKNFNLGGYAFNQSLSTDKEWVFTR